MDSRTEKGEQDERDVCVTRPIDQATSTTPPYLRREVPS